MEKYEFEALMRYGWGSALADVQMWGLTCLNLSTPRLGTKFDKRETIVHYKSGRVIWECAVHTPHIWGEPFGPKYEIRAEFSPVFAIYPQFFATYPQVNGLLPFLCMIL